MSRPAGHHWILVPASAGSDATLWQVPDDRSDPPGLPDGAVPAFPWPRGEAVTWDDASRLIFLVQMAPAEMPRRAGSPVDPVGWADHGRWLGWAYRLPDGGAQFHCADCADFSGVTA
jgi:hypothetical protein